MIIFPAIDIKDGKCVRLLKGDYNNVTHYKKSPLEQAEEFFHLGFKNIHIIDLDGALEGKLVNKSIIEKIINKNNFKIQVGGGIRSLENIKSLIDVGVDKVIVGTAAIKNQEFLEMACEKFSKKIALSLDVRNGFLALSGWKKQTDILALEFVKKITQIGISRIIYTDINRDGTKLGPNIEDAINFSKTTNIPIVISGGVASIKDILNIKEKKNPNIEGVVIGKAIYDGNIDLHELSKII